jgi:hypothetical protein
MIVWYCDICNNRIADTSGLQGLAAPVWALTINSAPVRNLKDTLSRPLGELIVCEECKRYVIEEIFKTIQAAIKIKRNEQEGAEEEK